MPFINKKICVTCGDVIFNRKSNAKYCSHCAEIIKSYQLKQGAIQRARKKWKKKK